MADRMRATIPKAAQPISGTKNFFEPTQEVGESCYGSASLRDLSVAKWCIDRSAHYCHPKFRCVARSYLSRSQDLVVAEVAIGLGVVTLITAPVAQFGSGILFNHFERLSTRIPLVLVAFLTAATPCFAGMLVTQDLFYALAFIALGNLGLGLAAFAGIFGVQELSPASSRGSANAIFMSMVTLLGVGLGPFTVGALSAYASDLGLALLAVLSGCAMAAVSLAPFLNRSFATIARRQARQNVFANA